jgi:hypothetical protein
MPGKAKTDNTGKNRRAKYSAKKTKKQGDSLLFSHVTILLTAITDIEIPVSSCLPASAPESSEHNGLMLRMYWNVPGSR